MIHRVTSNILVNLLRCYDIPIKVNSLMPHMELIVEPHVGCPVNDGPRAYARSVNIMLADVTDFLKNPQ